ncbi:MAG: hypothetical protein JO224_03955 [Pelomonas sp.]|nr:hypothetical protein [Roseateles sp.]
MNSLRTSIRNTRLVFCALTAGALLATASAATAPPPADSDSFTPGWHADAIRVANLGPAPGVPGRDRYVLAGMPHGDFVLVQRVGDKAKLLDTAVITVHSSIENHYVFLEAGLGKVFALPVKDVPAAKNLGVESSR